MILTLILLVLFFCFCLFFIFWEEARDLDPEALGYFAHKALELLPITAFLIIMVLMVIAIKESLS